MHFRKAELCDLLLYYRWANDKAVRESSFNSSSIDLEKHTIWFNNVIGNPNYSMYLFFNELNEPVGQVRILKEDNENATISVSVDKFFRGNGIAEKIIRMASDNFLENENNNYCINAFIKKSNYGSTKAFTKAGFNFKMEVEINKIISILLTKFIKQNSKNA